MIAKNRNKSMVKIGNTNLMVGALEVDPRFESHDFLRYQLKKLGLDERDIEEIVGQSPEVVTLGELLEVCE